MLKWLKSWLRRFCDEPDVPEEEPVVVRYFIGYTVFYGTYHNSPRDTFCNGWAVLDLRDGIDDTNKVLLIQSKLQQAQKVPNPNLVIHSINPLQVWPISEYQEMNKQEQAPKGP